MRKIYHRFVIYLLFLALTLASPLALTIAQQRTGLFFREEWREIPAAKPVTQEHVCNPDLILSLYGPGSEGIKKSHHDSPADDPWYIWSGEAEGNWAITLRHKNAWADLTGIAKVRWRTKQAGFRQLHILLKLADGKWLVSDQYDDQSNDWRIREFNISDIRWRQLDIKKVLEGPWEQSPDLTRVDEIGWTDLMPGGGSEACSRVDWIEVYGKTVPRNH
jgi:hypothetical protein